MKNVIRPKVENGKVLLDRDNPLHRYIFNDGEFNLIENENYKSLEEREIHLKKAIETTKRINVK